MKTLYTIILAIFLFGACSSSESNQPLVQIMAEASIDAPVEPISLNKIAKNIRLIPLETTTECLIATVNGFEVSGKNIFVNNKGQTALLFTTDGKFVNAVGANGRGPNEYLNVENLWVKGDKVYIFDIYANNLLTYDLQGKFISLAKIDGYLKSNLTTFEMLPNGNFVSFSPDKGPAPKTAMLTFASLSNDGGNFQLLDSIPHIKPLAEVANVNWYFREGQFAKNGEKVLYKSTLNDTIYNINSKDGKYTLSPQYVFNLGKYAAIQDTRIQTSKSFLSSKPFNAFSIMAKIELLGESNRYIFYKAKDEFYYFYDKKSNKINKWQIIPEGKEDACKENPNFFTPLSLDSNGNLLGVMLADSEDSNPVLVIAELK